MNRNIPIAASLLLIVAGCAGHKATKQQARPEPVTVRVTTVTACSGNGSASYVGRAEAVRSATIVAPAGGTLRDVRVREGSRVSAGQQLARIESQRLQSLYDAAKAQLSQAEDGMQRVEQVYRSGAVTESQYIDIQTKYKEAQASFAAAGSALEKCSLRAPYPGVVESIEACEGEELGIGAPILRIVDPSAVEVHFPIPEGEFAAIAVGDSARVQVPALGRSFGAVVRSKGVVASRASHSYDCILSLKAEGLMPGMVCKVAMATEASGAMVVPASSVLTDMEGRYVWMVEDGKVQKRRIVVGGYKGDGIVVAEGLSAGEQLIVEGSRKVSSGMNVNTVE